MSELKISENEFNLLKLIRKLSKEYKNKLEASPEIMINAEQYNSLRKSAYIQSLVEITENNVKIYGIRIKVKYGVTNL